MRVFLLFVGRRDHTVGFCVALSLAGKHSRVPAGIRHGVARNWTMSWKRISVPPSSVPTLS